MERPDTHSQHDRQDWMAVARFVLLVSAQQPDKAHRALREADVEVVAPDTTR